MTAGSSHRPVFLLQPYFPGSPLPLCLALLRLPARLAGPVPPFLLIRLIALIGIPLPLGRGDKIGHVDADEVQSHYRTRQNEL